MMNRHTNLFLVCRDHSACCIHAIFDNLSILSILSILIFWHHSACFTHAIPNETSFRSGFGMLRPQCMLHWVHAWWIVIQIWFQSVSRLASKTLRFKHFTFVSTPHLWRQINWTCVSHHCSLVCGLCLAFSCPDREFCCQLPCSGGSLTAFCLKLRRNLRA